MKKIVIIIIFLVALFLFIFRPFGMDGVIEDWIKDGGGGFWGYVEAYYIISGGLLCWVGISAAYNFVEYKNFPGWLSLICILIGFFLSPIIALIQLFIPKR